LHFGISQHASSVRRACVAPPTIVHGLFFNVAPLTVHE
jgi:hypothetical protein